MHIQGICKWPLTCLYTLKLLLKIIITKRVIVYVSFKSIKKSKIFRHLCLAKNCMQV